MISEPKGENFALETRVCIHDFYKLTYRQSHLIETILTQWYSILCVAHFCIDARLEHGMRPTEAWIFHSRYSSVVRSIYETALELSMHFNEINLNEKHGRKLRVEIIICRLLHINERAERCFTWDPILPLSLYFRFETVRVSQTH